MMSELCLKQSCCMMAQGVREGGSFIHVGKENGASRERYLFGLEVEE